MKKSGAIHGAGGTPSIQRRLEQGKRAKHVGLQKGSGIDDRSAELSDEVLFIATWVLALLPVLALGDGACVADGAEIYNVAPITLGARAVVGTIPAYAATKGAIDTLVKHFAALLGARGIRVNAVAPGVVATEMSSFVKTEEGRDYALGIQALKRLAQPDDIAGTVAFLASDAARWITGETIHVDGGSKL